MKNVIVFDFDGVLIDSLTKVEEFDQWLYPGLTDAEWRKTTLGNYFEMMREHESKRRNASEAELETKRKSFYEEKTLLLPISGMPDVVKTLNRNYQLAINTTSKRDGVVPWLERNGLASYFGYVAYKELSTSKVEKFKLIFDHFGVESKDVYFVTDTIGDLQEANELKIDTVCVTWGIHSREEFMRFHPFRIVDSPKELMTL